MSSRPRSMRFARRSRVIEPLDLEPEAPSEEFRWKKKYRQSLNDIDLANKFAEFMPADLRDNFLDHNKAEFETVLDARPRTANPQNGLPEDYLTAWQDLDLTPITPTTTASRRQSRRLSQYHPRTSTYITSLPPIPPQWAGETVPALPPTPPAPVFTERYREAEPEVSRWHSKESERPRKRKNSMLRPMRSFVSFLRRPSFK